MLQGHQSISTFTPINASIWMALAFQAGALNIGGLLASHNVVSHVTGYFTQLGLSSSASDNWTTALALLIAPLFFLFGSMISGVLVDLRLKLNKKPKYYLVFGVIFGFLLLLEAAGLFGLFGVFGEPLTLVRDYLLLALLCLVCGIQNGTVTLVSKSIVRTTHMTGIVTDLGVGLVRVLNHRRLSGKIRDEGKANLMRAGLILFFILGAGVGAPVFSHWGFAGFTIPLVISGALFFTTFYFQVLH